MRVCVCGKGVCKQDSVHECVRVCACCKCVNVHKSVCVCTLCIRCAQTLMCEYMHMSVCTRECMCAYTCTFVCVCVHALTAVQSCKGPEFDWLPETKDRSRPQAVATPTLWPGRSTPRSDLPLERHLPTLSDSSVPESMPGIFCTPVQPQVGSRGSSVLC